jgi:hypothetical protein
MRSSRRELLASVRLSGRVLNLFERNAVFAGGGGAGFEFG